MNVIAATSLVEYINQHSARYSAVVLQLPRHEQGWVMVEDRQTRRHLEPIADPYAYLRCAREGTLKLDPPFHALLQAWIKTRPPGETGSRRCVLRRRNPLDS